MNRIVLDPALGDVICDLIEGEAGVECHIVLIVCPLEGGKLGQPTFISSLHPDVMEDFLIQIAGNLAVVGKSRVVTGGSAN